MRTLRFLAVLGAVVMLSGTGVSQAAPAGSGGPPVSPINDEDLYYDFEVYAGEPNYAWFIAWQLPGGGTQEDGPFSSEQEAGNWAVKLYVGGYQPAGSQQWEIVEQEIDPVMIYVDTFDTRAEAEAFADLLESLGLYTDVRRVSIFSYSLRR